MKVKYSIGGGRNYYEPIPLKGYTFIGEVKEEHEGYYLVKGYKKRRDGSIKDIIVPKKIVIEIIP